MEEERRINKLKESRKLPIDCIILDEEILKKRQGEPDYDGIARKLAEDISKNGLKTPLQVLHFQDGRYKLIEGYRRYEACKRLGLKELDCIVKENINPFSFKI
jgi:ParB family chromosome partitioning protein